MKVRLADEARRLCAMGMALQHNEASREAAREFYTLDGLLGAARKIEAYLKGDAASDFRPVTISDLLDKAPEPKCFTQPDPTFKNEVLNDVDA